MDLLSSIGGVYDDAVSWVRSNLSPDASLQYIRSNMAWFRGLGGQIFQLQQRAKSIAVQAAQSGRPDIQQDMVQRINWLGQLNNFYGGVLDKVDQLENGLQQLGVPGLGVVALPVVLVAIAVAIVGAMIYCHFHVTEQSQALDTQQHVLDLLQQGRVTASQAVALTHTAADTAAQSTQTGLAGTLGAIKSLAWPAVLVVGALVVLPELRKAAPAVRRLAAGRR